VRTVMAHLFSSLDGYASDRDDEDMRWVMERQGAQQMTVGQQHVRSLSLLVLGRVTYEIMAAYWPNASDQESGGWATIMNSVPKMVFSQKLNQADVSWANTTVNNGDLVEEIAKLKAQDGGEIGLSGSVEVVKSLLRAGLLDRLLVQVYPVILGSDGGKHIYSELDTINLSLANATVLDDQVVLLDYEPANR
jgi:dihydrofolate reductase